MMAVIFGIGQTDRQFVTVAIIGSQAVRRIIKIIMSEKGNAILNKINADFVAGIPDDDIRTKRIIRFESDFKLGQIVYLVTDKDQAERIITSFQVDSRGVLYQLSHGASASWHFDIEITHEKDVLKSVS